MGSVTVNREPLVAVLDVLGKSERELARTAGLSHSTINHMVTGRRVTCMVVTASAVLTVLVKWSKDDTDVRKIVDSIFGLLR